MGENQSMDYLIVCVRVKGDLERPGRTFQELSRREDVPTYLSRDLQSWLEEMEEFWAEQLDGFKAHAERTRGRRT